MKVGMTSLTLRDKSIENVFECAKKAELDGIEWGVSEKHVSLDNDAQIDKIKEESRKNGIEIFSIGSYCRMTDKAE